MNCTSLDVFEKIVTLCCDFCSVALSPFDGDLYKTCLHEALRWLLFGPEQWVVAIVRFVLGSQTAALLVQ